MTTASVRPAEVWSAALSDLPLGKQVEVAGAAIGLALLRRAAASGSAPIAARAWLTLPAALRWQWVGHAARAVPDFAAPGAIAPPVPKPTDTPPATQSAPPAAPSPRALELVAWLGEILLKLADRNRLSPTTLNRRLKVFREDGPPVKRALQQIRFAGENGAVLTGTQVLAQVLEDPRTDPAFAGAIELAARREAFDLLCTRRAALLTDLMHRVAREVTGNADARRRQYTDDPSWRATPPTGAKI